MNPIMKTQRILLAIALASSFELAREALADGDVGLDVKTQVQPAATDVDDDSDASREVDVDDAGDPSREEDVDEATRQSPGSADGDEVESDEEVEAVPVDEDEAGDDADDEDEEN